LHSSLFFFELSSSANARLSLLESRTPASPLPAPPRTTQVSVLLLALIILVSYFGYFSGLGTLGLVGPDEPRYVSIARSMAQSHDWVTPRLNGQPWFEKPILYYWAAAITFRVAGVSDYAARFPAALAALLAALAMAWAAWRCYGPATAAIVLLLMPTSVAIVGLARAATPDMLFAATLAAAMVFGAELVVARKPDILHRLGFGVFLGAATLAKGPAAIALAGGSVALWALLSGQWRRAFRLAHPLSIVTFALVAVPWYFLCAARNPNFLDVFLLQHNVARFLTPVFHHVQPFWFFLPIMILAVIPWSALLFDFASDAAAAWRKRDWAARPGLYFGCWSFFTVVFFSISKSKLPDYILPAVPPLVLLLAHGATRLIQRADESARGVAMGLGATWVALVAGAEIWLRRLPPASMLTSPFAGLTVLQYALISAGVIGAVIAVLGSRGRIAAALLTNAALVAALLAVANWAVLPAIDATYSSRATANAALPVVGAATAANAVDVYRLDRTWQYGLEYYLGRAMPEWTPAESLPILVFTNEGGCKDIQRRGMICEVLQKIAPAAWLVRISAPVNHASIQTTFSGTPIQLGPLPRSLMRSGGR
jgi:4-amino-4-deoxy-L-arabinose transferase-like glycosyltransferase